MTAGRHESLRRLTEHLRTRSSEPFDGPGLDLSISLSVLNLDLRIGADEARSYLCQEQQEDDWIIERSFHMLRNSGFHTLIFLADPGVRLDAFLHAGHWLTTLIAHDCHDGRARELREDSIEHFPWLEMHLPTWSD